MDGHVACEMEASDCRTYCGDFDGVLYKCRFLIGGFSFSFLL